MRRMRARSTWNLDSNGPGMVSLYGAICYGWLAQLGERFVHTEEVVGSSPIPPTISFLSETRRTCQRSVSPLEITRLGNAARL
jgi:hypothetical protein